MPARPSDKFIPWYFVLFFAAQLALFSGFAYIAHHSYTGLVIEDSYSKGLKYNAVIAAADAQEKLGWRMAVGVRGDAEHTRITLSLADKAGAAIDDADVRLWLVRPVQAGMDQQLALKAMGSGNYSVETNIPAPGLWELRIEAQRHGDRAQLITRREI